MCQVNQSISRMGENLTSSESPNIFQVNQAIGKKKEDLTKSESPKICHVNQSISREEDNSTSSEVPKICEVCEKPFKSKKTLAVHLKVVHEGKKAYSCNKCEAIFARKDYLKTHLRSHNGEKPFQCVKCNKNFRQKATLNGHYKICSYI